MSFYEARNTGAREGDQDSLTDGDSEALIWLVSVSECRIESTVSLIVAGSAKNVVSKDDAIFPFQVQCKQARLGELKS